MLLSLFWYGPTIVRRGRDGHLLHEKMHLAEACSYMQMEHDAEICTSKCALYILSISYVIFSEIFSNIECCRNMPTHVDKRFTIYVVWIYVDITVRFKSKTIVSYININKMFCYV
jgi:hypothetical protein